MGKYYRASVVSYHGYTYVRILRDLTGTYKDLYQGREIVEVEAVKGHPFDSVSHGGYAPDNRAKYFRDSLVPVTDPDEIRHVEKLAETARSQ